MTGKMPVPPRRLLRRFTPRNDKVRPSVTYLFESAFVELRADLERLQTLAQAAVNARKAPWTKSKPIAVFGGD